MKNKKTQLFIALVISLFSVTQNMRAQDNGDTAEAITEKQKYIKCLSAKQPKVVYLYDSKMIFL